MGSSSGPRLALFTLLACLLGLPSDTSAFGVLRAPLSAAPHRVVSAGLLRTGPRMMFDRFGPEAVNVLMYAQQETRRMGCAEVGTEHVLLGVLHTPEAAAKALKANGIELAAAQAKVRVPARGTGPSG